MTSTLQPGPTLVFGDFEFSPERLELWRGGELIRMQQQPLKLLAALLRRPGMVVTREELRGEIWGEGVHLDFADTLNHTVKYLRDALEDDASSPRFVETVPRRGYRFIAKVVAKRPGAAAAAPPAAVAAPPSRRTYVSPLRMVIAAAAVIALALALVATASPPDIPRVVGVAKITNFGLADKLVAGPDRLFIQQEKGGVLSIVQVPTSGGDPAPLATPFRNTRLLDVSPDGKELLLAGFDAWNDPPLIWALPLAGGPPRRVGTCVGDSARYSPDGARIAFSGRLQEVAEDDAIYVVHADGSEPRKLTGGGGDIDGWAPDGQRLRFTRTNAATGGMSLWEVGLQGAPPKLFLPDRTNRNARWGEGLCCGQWTRDGRYFIYQDTAAPKVTLWAVESRTGLLAVRQKQPVELYAAGFTLSIFGTPALKDHRAYVVGHNESRELERFDGGQKPFVPVLGGLHAGFIRWSPDRQWIAYVAYPEMTLWKCRADGSQRVRLLAPPAQAYAMAWSPDGKRIAVHVLSPGQLGKVALVPADGGAPQILFEHEATQEDAPSWSPDGARLMLSRSAVDANGLAGDSSIVTVELAGGRVTEVPGSKNLGPPVWSPDGKYVVAQSEDFRRLLLYDFHSQQWTSLAQGSYLFFPQWSADSKAVYYQDTRGGEQQPVYRVSVPGGRAVEIASRSQILHPDVAEYRLVALTPDEKPVVVLVRHNGDVYALEVDLP